MELQQYQISAFTSRQFGGNPAAIVPLKEWLPTQVMQAVAAENNLSETAFYVQEGSGYGLRWFTPADEVDFVSRFFAPQVGIDEDPLTGSAP